MRRNFRSLFENMPKSDPKSSGVYGRLGSKPFFKILIIIGLIILVFLLLLAGGYGMLFILNLLFP